jgi:hypothetical protein
MDIPQVEDNNSIKKKKLKKLVYNFFMNLKRIPKENETKEIKIKIKTTKKELSGISIELLGIGKDEFSEIYNLNSEINNSSHIISCIINGKDTNSINHIKTSFELYKKKIEEFLFNSKDTLKLRVVGNQCFIESIENDEEIDWWYELNLNPKEFQNLEIKLNTNLEINNNLLNYSFNELTEKICSFKFLLKGIIRNINHLLLSFVLIKELNESLSEDEILGMNIFKLLITLEKIDLSFDISSKKLNENFLLPFIFSFSETDEDPNEIKKNSKKLLSEEFKKKIEEMKILDALKSTLLDEINFFLFFPKLKYGFNLKLKLNGLTKFLNENILKDNE